MESFYRNFLISMLNSILALASASGFALNNSSINEHPISMNSNISTLEVVMLIIILLSETLVSKWIFYVNSVYSGSFDIPRSHRNLCRLFNLSYNYRAFSCEL